MFSSLDKFPQRREFSHLPFFLFWTLSLLILFLWRYTWPTSISFAFFISLLIYCSRRSSRRTLFPNSLLCANLHSIVSKVVLILGIIFQYLYWQHILKGLEVYRVYTSQVTIKFPFSHLKIHVISYHNCQYSCMKHWTMTVLPALVLETAILHQMINRINSWVST